MACAVERAGNVPAGPVSLDVAMESTPGRHVCVVRPADLSGADEDARLLENARADPAAFARVYERYLARVYRYCLRRLDTREEAEDATALVFTRALAGVSGYRGGSVAAWVFRIAHHTVANELRDRRSALSLDTSPLSETHNPVTPEFSVLDAVVQAEERQRLTRLLATLPAEQRENGFRRVRNCADYGRRLCHSRQSTR